MYKRIVLKLSGEALAGDKDGAAFDDTVIWGLVRQIKTVIERGSRSALFVAGGISGADQVHYPNLIRKRQNRVGCLLR